MSKEKKGKFKFIKFIFRYALLLLIVGLLIFIVQYRINNTDKTIYVAPKPTVKIEKPHIDTIEKEVTFPTYIEAKDMIIVIPLVPGTILSYDVRVGDYVYKDQILAEIDSSMYKQQLIQAEAAYNAYKSTFDRVEALYKKKATTAQNYDEVKSKLEAAKAQVELAKIQLSYASVTSPIEGTVLQAPLATGNIASSSSPIAVIANLESQIVNIQVPEKYYDIFIKNQDQITINISRPQSNATTSATLISIDPFIKPQSKVFVVKANLEGDLTYFKPGMYSLASITYEKIENVYVLNQEAKKLDGSLYYYDESDKSAHFLPKEFVNTNDENNEMFRISDEYSSYNFIVEGQNTVFDSQKVNVITNTVEL